jgi:hypothetical protein
VPDADASAEVSHAGRPVRSTAVVVDCGVVVAATDVAEPSAGVVPVAVPSAVVVAGAAVVDVAATVVVALSPDSMMDLPPELHAAGISIAAAMSAVMTRERRISPSPPRR